MHILTKMYKKCLIYLILTVLLAQVSYSASIHGVIYDSQLNPLDNVILEVNSTPKQTFVSKDNSYSFTLPKGNYLITAKSTEDYQKIGTEELVTILTTEGGYTLDLILFPDLSEELELLEESPDIDISGLDFQKNYWWILIVCLFIILFFIFRKKLKFKKHKPQNLSPEQETPKENSLKEGDKKREVLDFIRENQGRITQKDIRKRFPLSEAKISLILTELEEDQIIRKVKRGRSNIIFLNK